MGKYNEWDSDNEVLKQLTRQEPEWSQGKILEGEKAIAQRDELLETLKQLHAGRTTIGDYVVYLESRLSKLPELLVDLNMAKQCFDNALPYSAEQWVKSAIAKCESK